jgi:hypothetical protein
MAMRGIDPEIELVLQAKLEIKSCIRRRNLRRQSPGKSPAWKYNKHIAKPGCGCKKWNFLVSISKAILLPKLVAFAKEYTLISPTVTVESALEVNW